MCALSPTRTSLLLLTLAVSIAQAQPFAVDNYPTSSPPNGTVLDCAYQNDGRLIVVGEFTQAGNFSRGRLARYTLAGAPDSSFVTGSGANATIRALAVAPDNSLIIGGDFTRFNGRNVSFLARLFPNGRIDTNFAGEVDGPVHDLAIVDNFIYLCGEFSRGVMRLDLTGRFRTRVAGSGLNGPAYTLAVEPFLGPFVTVGGQFTRASGATVGNLVTLDRNLQVIPPAPGVTGANGPVFALAVHQGETPFRRPNLIVGGRFSRLNNTPRSNLALIYGNEPSPASPRRGTLVPNSLLGTNSQALVGEVRSLALAENQFELAIGGSFTVPGARNWRNFIMASPTGFTGNPPANRYRPDATVHALAFQPDDMLALGGEFTSLDGRPHSHLARLLGFEGDSLPDTPTITRGAGIDVDKIFVAWDPVDNVVGYKLEMFSAGGSPRSIPLDNPQATQAFLRGLTPGTSYLLRVSAFNGNGSSPPSPFAVYRTLAQPPGGIPDPSFRASPGHIGSATVAVDSQQRILVDAGRSILRYLQDGTQDEGFDVSISSGRISTILVQPDDRILVAGSSMMIDEGERALIRLLPDGSLDPSFDTRVIGEISDLALLADNRIALVGAPGGLGVHSFALLSPDGQVAASSKTIDQHVTPAVSVQALPDGSLLVGSDFSGINARPISAVTKMTPEGLIDPSFTVPSDHQILSARSLAMHREGKILVWGTLAPKPLLDGFEPTRLFQLEADGSPDASFGPNGLGQPISSPVTPLVIHPQPDGTVVVGGRFQEISNIPRFGLAKFSAQGVLDPNFTGGCGLQGSTAAGPNGFAALPDGRIAIVGGFLSANEVAGRPAILTAGPFPSPASAPTSLSVTSEGTGQLLLSWSPASQQTGSLIERNDGVEGWIEIARLPANATRFYDRNLPVGQEFSYRIAGLSGSQVSETWSPTAAATVASPFGRWLRSHDLAENSAPDLDPDGDGWNLFFEFALQRDPHSPETRSWYNSFGGHPLSLVAPATAPSVRYTLEISTDGSTWTPHSSTVGASGGQIQATFEQNGARSFLVRLKVQSIP